MGIRMSGLSSGLDTEAIVGALMSAQSLKKTKIERNKTKLEWTQTKWAELNTKLYKLYTEQVSKMRLQSSYQTKKATVSDPTKANVTAKNDAVNGSYTLEVKNIATTQYLSGAKIKAEAVTDKLVDLDPALLNKEIEITNGDKTTKFEITGNTTIADFTKALQDAGLNASYDTDQQRFFISSKESGLGNAFSISTSGLTVAEVAGREAIRNAVGYDNMSKDNKKIVDEAMQALQKSGVGTDEYNKALDSLAKAAYDTKKTATDSAAAKYVQAKLYSESYATYETKAKDELKSSYYDDAGNLLDGKTEDEYNKAVKAKADEYTTNFVNREMSTNNDVKLQVEAAAFSGKTAAEIQALGGEGINKYYSKDGGAPVIEGFDGTNTFSESGIKAAITSDVENYANITDRNDTLSGSALSALGLADISVDADGNVSVNGGANDSSNTLMPKGMSLVAASDSVILLNGAELTSKSSTVSANGLEIELTGLTKNDGPITFSVSNDVDSVYNSVKSFLKEYNEIMKEMKSLYNAESAKGYEPLTSEQKKAMSDDDVKLWEDKIKGALLRNDSTLGSIMSSMRSAMMSQVTYEGKSYSLASFGIMTSTDYTEGGLLHIYGDTEDAVYADKDDKLKKALAEDPDAVMNVLSGIFENLRTTMSQKMAGSKTSSAMTFYNDITMKDQLKTYEKDIKAWEKKLASMEDAYYKKFTAMEVALAKLQSQQSSLAGLFGGN